jgi:serine/threonine-protein kinase
MAVTSPPKLGRYEIVEEIGKGAMGVVYLARDPLIGRLVALKTFRVGFSVGDDDLMQFRARFMREAQSAGILSHPNIVTIHDVQDGATDGFSFIAMEYVPGVNLKELLQREEPLEVEFVESVIAQIAAALDYAHSKGVIHRDVKPANVIIDLQKRVKITDFGIARLESSNLTQDGQLLGTPNYMAPEQILGKELDHRVDVFSLGVVLYELLTRRKPFQGENLTIVSHRIAFEDFTPARQFTEAITPAIEAVLARALEKDPQQRYPTAGALAAELKRAVDVGAAGPTARTAEGAATSPPTAPPVAAAQITPEIGASGRPPAVDSAGPLSATAELPVNELPLLQYEPAPGRVPTERDPAPPEAPSAAGQVPAPPREEVGETAGGGVGASQPAQALSWQSSGAKVEGEVSPPASPTPGSRSAKGGGSPAAAPPAGRARGWLNAAVFGLLAGGLLAAALIAFQPDAGPLPRPSAEAELLARLQPHLQSALFMERLGDTAGAIVELKESERIAPDRPGLKRRRQRLEEAIAKLGQEGAASAAVAALVTAGEDAFGRRRYAEAVEKAKLALAQRPDLAAASDLLARAEAGLAARGRAAERAGAKPEAPPVPTAAPLPPVPAVAPAGDPVLDIDFLTEPPFSEGALTIYVNKKQVMLEPFRFFKKTGILRSEAAAGRVQDKRTLQAGDTTIQVYVTPTGKPARTVTLQGNFPLGAHRLLRIHLDKAGELTGKLE